MDSLNLDRHIKNFSSDFSFTGFVMPQSLTYEPIFNFSSNYSNIVGNTLDTPYSFDSNFYFMNFGSPYAPLSEPSSMFALTSLFSLPLFSLPTLTLSKVSLPKAKQTVSAQTTYSDDKDNKYTSLKDAGYSKKLAKKLAEETASHVESEYTSLEYAGYNKELAEKLAEETASHVESEPTGFCAKYVSNAMERLGIVGKRGDAYELRDSLRNNPHFKEIDASTVDVKNLPAGCVLVYQKGDAGYSSKYGHVEVTLGNGTAASDFINNNIKQSSNMSIFVPVSA